MTLYDTLQVSPGASTEVIHASVRALLRKFHPDNSETADEAKFRAVKAASVILENAEKRKAYDATLRNGHRPKKKGGAVNHDAYPPAYPSPFVVPAVKFDVRQMAQDALAAAGTAAFNKLMADNPVLAEMLRGRK